MAKVTDNPAGTGVSNEATEQAATTTATALAPLTESSSGDVTGSTAQLFTLSTETQDRLMQEFGEALHQVQDGFGELTAPGDIFKRGEAFDVIDALTISDFEDRNTGEIKTKHIFKLEFGNGQVLMTMQSDARPRRILAEAFVKARALGVAVRVGPYKYDAKVIPRQIQPAYIFVQQPGFAARPDTQRKQVAA